MNEILFHGSTRYFDRFDLEKSRLKLDFGRGIYLSTRQDHSASIIKTNVGYVYSYEVNLTEAREFLRIFRFRSDSLEWVKFVLDNRHLITGTQLSSIRARDYDIIMGPTVDNVLKRELDSITLDEGFALLSKTEQNKKLVQIRDKFKPGVYPEQVCLKTQKAVNLFDRSRVGMWIIGPGGVKYVKC